MERDWGEYDLGAILKPRQGCKQRILWFIEERFLECLPREYQGPLFGPNRLSRNWGFDHKELIPGKVLRVLSSEIELEDPRASVQAEVREALKAVRAELEKFRAKQWPEVVLGYKIT